MGNEYNSYRKSIRKWCLTYIKHQLSYDFKYTNHTICHELFKDIYDGRGSQLYIEIDLNIFCVGNDDSFTEVNDNNFMCSSLISRELLEYDSFAFSYMQQRNKGRESSRTFYRPFIFNYVSQIDKNQLKKIKQLVRQYENPINESKILVPCTFQNNRNNTEIKLEGFVQESASATQKYKHDLFICNVDMTDYKQFINMYNQTYDFDKSPVVSDCDFEQKLSVDMNDSLTAIQIYKIGNANCVFAYGNNMSFFFDIGLNSKHSANALYHNKNYTYRKSMRMIAGNNPNFVILSHWDIDHIAGVSYMSKKIFNKHWYAPDCYDACLDAKRLAMFLNFKGNLILAKRKEEKARKIANIIVNTSQNMSDSYSLYMGKGPSADNRAANCEGIVIEYCRSASSTQQINTLLMGDVNYKAFNNARINEKEAKFCDSNIDYLIVPHHGSHYTNYEEINNNNNQAGANSYNVNKEAIICCINNTATFRPDKDHLNELIRRFGYKNVMTTEEIDSANYYRITY